MISKAIRDKGGVFHYMLALWEEAQNNRCARYLTVLDTTLTAGNKQTNP